MRERLRRSRDWSVVIDELEREAEGLATEQERSEMLFELGALTEEVIPERDRALGIYQRAWKVFPENIKALTRARQVYRELGRLEMVAKVGELEIKVRAGDAEAGLLAGLVGEALLDCGQKDRASELLERALEAQPESTRLRDALAATQYDTEDWIDQVERLASDASKFDSATAARMLLRAARIVNFETPDDPMAERLIRQVLANDPQNEAANFLFEQLLSRGNRWEDLETHHENRAFAVADERERAELYRAFALEWVQRWGDRERGARFFAKAFQSSSQNGSKGLQSTVAGFSLLHEVHGAKSEWRQYLEVTDLALGHSLTDDQRLYVALQAAKVAWKQVADVDRARKYFDMVREVSPDSPDLLDFEREHGSAPAVALGTSPGNAVVVERAAKTEVMAVPPVEEEPEAPAKRKRGKAPSAAPPAVSGAMADKIEAARSVEQGNADKGLEAWRKLIAEDPSQRAPRREYARALRQLERWPALADALKDEESKAAKDPASQLEVLTELVTVYRQMRNDALALGVLTQMAKIDGSNLDVLDQLVAQYETMKRWPDLVATLSKKAPLVTDARERIELYLQIAQLYIEKFSNQAEAIKAFEKVLELDPDNVTAAGHLREVYEKRRDWDKLIALREREIARTEDAVARAAMTYEVAQLAATKLKKPEVCQIWWAKVLETDPGHEEALTELEKLYERSKSWDKLAEICARRADLASDAKKKVDALQKLGLLYTDKLADNLRAIDAWKRLVAIEPDNRRAQDALKKLFVAARSWRDLEVFYRDQGKVDEYVRVLERQVDEPNEPDRLQLALSIAVLYRDELQKADRAMRAYEKVLSFDEHNLEAAEALIPLYEQARDPKKLVRVLEIQLEQTPAGEAELRQERIRRLAEYSEEKLRDKGAAYGWWLRALSQGEDHELEGIRAQVERLAKETGGFAELVDAYRAAASKYKRRVDALPLLQVVAATQERELGELDAALATNRSILEVEPQDPQALDALERLYLGKQNYGDLLAIYRAKLDQTLDADQRTQILVKTGQLYEDELGDDAQAIATYRQILELNGEDLAALRALDRISTRTQAWTDLAEILAREIALVDPSTKTAEHVELKRRLGQVREEQLGDAAGAIELYREILELEAGHDGARRALERRLDGEHALTAAGILEPIYQGQGEWQPLIRVHEIQLAAEKDPAARVALLMQIGELHGKRLGDAEKAFDAYARAFGVDPSAGGAKHELEELADLVDDGGNRLVKLFEGALSKPDVSPALTHELSLKVARAYEEHLGDSARAVEYFRRALAIEPDDLGAIDALERTFTREERYAELLEIYRRKVEITRDPDERLGILFRIASLHEEMLQHPADAIATYNEILGHDAENVRALRSLDRLYQTGEAWQDLGDNLVRQLGLMPDRGAKIELLVRLADLRERRLGERAAAIETYRQVLELDEGNRAATAALEAFLTDAAHELVVAQILEPIYRAGGDVGRQIGVYEILARHALDPERKIELYHAIAELHEVGADDTGSAFDTFARAFREEPRSEGTAAQLDRLARASGRWRDVVALYDAIAGEAADDDLKISLLSRLAQLHEHELRDDKAAVATYERVLATAPGQIDAASAIQAIHERNGDYRALVGALARKAELIQHVPERKSLLFKAAQIQEEVLDDPDAAIATYRAVLETDDLDAHALEALERLYLRLERWAALKDVYAKKVELVDDPDDKKRTLHVLGQVYDRELGDVAKAIETYQAILDLDADELPAVQALDRLYGQAERWYDLLGNLERQVELAESSGEIVGLKYRVGRLWQDKLSDVARAIESYREALGIDHQHQETLVALDGLLRGDEGEPGVAAARVLEPIYEAGGENERLVGVLEVMVRHAEDPHRRVELLHRIAGLHEHRLGDAQAAFTAYARALREDNANEQSLGHLERLAESTRAWGELGRLLAAEADKSLDVPRQVDLLSRLARIHVEELGQIADAIAIYRRIVDVEFDNRAAILQLDRLYSGGERWAELCEILRKEIQLAERDEDALALQFRLGQTLEQNLRDLPAAIEVYREILTADPTHSSTLGALEMMFLEGHHELEIASVLEPLYHTGGEFEKLHKIYEVQLRKLTDPGDRQGMYLRLAELAEERLLDPARASAWWGEALAEDPSSNKAAEEVERLAREARSWNELVGIYGMVLQRHAEPAVQKPILLRMARVYDAELVDAPSAVETYLRVLDIDVRDAEALAALDRLYGAAGMFDELVEILRRRIEVTLDGDEIVEMQLRRGQLFAEALGDLDASLACYEQILEQDTRNRKALEAEEGIFFRREDWTRLHGVYEKLVDVADGDDEVAELYARMARIASDALDNEERSIDLWGRVLDIRAEDPIALQAIGELYARRGAWEELVEILDRQVAAARSDRERVDLHKRLGRVWADKLGRERNSLDAWLRAYELEPHDLETLQALAQLYRSTQAWEELSQTIRRIIEVGQHDGGVTERDLVELHAQLGQLEGDLLGRVNEAVDAWRKVLLLDPTDFRALEALEQLFIREGRWEECIEVLESRAAVIHDPQGQIDTLLQAAAIWEEKVDDKERAAELYERVRALQPGHPVSSGRLEELYRIRAKWTELNEVLLERVEHTDNPQERIHLLQTVAKTYDAELADQDSAFVVLQAAFKEDYSNESTAHELERLATAAGKWDDLLADYTAMVQGLEAETPDKAADLWVKIGRWYGEHLSHVDYAIHSVEQALRINGNHTGALAALAGLQSKRGSWHELVDTLGRHAAVEPDTGKKVELYLNLADLLESRLQDPMQAMAAYSAAAAADPQGTEALVSLERLHRRHEMWEQLIDVLARRAALLLDPEDAARLRLEIGSLWDERLGDPGQAIEAYQAVLANDPLNLPALRALEHLYEKTGQSERYLDNLEAQLDATGTDAERIALYERMSSAWEERFGKLDRAAEALEKIVAIDERNFDAYRELERLYRQQSRWDSLVDTQRRHILAVTDPAQRVSLYVAMGEVYEEELKDHDRAIEAFTDVLSFDPEEPRALDALGRLYEAIQEWDRAIDVMGQLVRATDDARRRVDLHYRIGRILQAHLQNPDEAEQHFQAALTIDATHVPTMEELVQLYADRGDWLKAAQLMAQAETYTPNVLDKIRLLFDAARIYNEKLGQKERAREFFGAVIALDPEHVEAAEPLAELYFEAGQFQELAPILDMLVRKAPQLGKDNRELNELYYRTARTADMLGDHKRALEFYKSAYDLDSTYLPTLVGRADLLFNMGDWEGAGKIYQTILVQHRDSQAESDVVRTYFRLGMVRQNLGERRKALNMFEKALEIDAGHPDTLNAVIAIQEQAGDFEAVMGSPGTELEFAL